MRLLDRYVTDKNGNVAITFALGVTVLLLIIGVALDYARAVRAKWTLQAATDAAVIMVANLQKGDAESRTLAQTMLNANTKFPASIKSLELPAANAVNKTTKLTSTYTLPTTLMSIFGVPTMTVDGYAAATRSIQKLDVVMVLDNSGSMTQDNRMPALISAATFAVDELKKNNTTLRIGLVPFNELVNVGSQFRTASWIDGAAPWDSLVSAKRKDGSMSSVNRFDLYDAMGIPWKGCVEARTSGYDVTDDPPVASVRATLFAPAFVPDDPGPSPTKDAYYSVLVLADSYDALLNHYVDDNGDCATVLTGNATEVMTDAQLQTRTARTCKYFKNTVNNTYVARGVSNLPSWGLAPAVRSGR